MAPRKYDPREFIIPARDGKGGTQRFWLNIQPGHKRALEIVLAEKKFPFRTETDIVRWCLHQGLKTLEALEEIPSLTAQVDAILDLLRVEQYQREYEETFRLTLQTIAVLTASGATGEATRVIAQVRARIVGIPESEAYWRQRYLDTLDERFGHLLEPEKTRIKSASLVALTKKNRHA